MEKEKYVDESWKESVAHEKDLGHQDHGEIKDERIINPAQEHKHAEEEGVPEVSFLNYVTSLAVQAMIFLGEIPNPMKENKTEINLKQAKFLIDTLLMMRDKTQGNLNKEEDDLLNASLYELQMRFVEHHNKEGKKGS